MKSKVDRILVTGGAGFIGSNYVHHLFHQAGTPAACCLDEQHFPKSRHGLPSVHNVDNYTYAANPKNLVSVGSREFSEARVDISDAKSVNAEFRAFRPAFVVHFAAESHVDRSIESGEVFARTNAVGTQVLLDAARRHDVGHFLHVSTDEVYGSIAKGKFAEDSPLDPSSPYSASKAASDLIVLAHGRTYGIKVVVTRCTNNYGPRQHDEKLIPKCISLAMRGDKLPIYGAGKNVREWIYVKDHCAALEFIRKAGLSQQVINISSGNEMTNIEVAKSILKATGQPEDRIEFVKDRLGHDLRYAVDSTKLRKLGWKPRVNFLDGLDYAVQWHKRESMS